MSEDQEPIYLRIGATEDGRVGLEVYLESNDERIYGFIWEPEYAREVAEYLIRNSARAEARKEWAEGQMEDNYISWLEEQWKGEGG